MSERRRSSPNSPSEVHRSAHSLNVVVLKKRRDAFRIVPENPVARDLGEVATDDQADDLMEQMFGTRDVTALSPEQQIELVEALRAQAQ